MNERSKCGRRYDREFREQAVLLVRNGRTLTEVSRDLGVGPGTLSRWFHRLEAGQTLSEASTLAGETAEQRELRRLRHENDYLRRQRDILKKALGILSAEMPPDALRS